MAHICLILSIVISVFFSIASSDVTDKMFNMLFTKTTFDVTLLRNDVNAMMSRMDILDTTLNELLETMKVNSEHNGRTVEGIGSLDKTDGMDYTKYVSVMQKALASEKRHFRIMKDQFQTQIREFETSMIVKQQDVATQTAAMQQIVDFNNYNITKQVSAVEQTVSSNKQEIMSKISALEQTGVLNKQEIMSKITSLEQTGVLGRQEIMSKIKALEQTGVFSKQEIMSKLATLEQTGVLNKQEIMSKITGLELSVVLNKQEIMSKFTALEQTVNSDKMTLEHWKDTIAYEVAILKDPCVSSPCTKNDLCVSNTGSYTCTCTAGWTGKNCKKDVSHCSSNPCENGATCIKRQNNFTCNCAAGWTGRTCTTVSPTDCYDVLHLGVGDISGVYTVRMPQSHDLVNVYCDMTTDGGGWTVFQYRFDGSVDFYEIFARYETGFGDVHGEFWLGLKFIYEMTHQTKSEIYLNFVDSNGNIAMERFSDFYISAGSDYTLHIGQLLQRNDTSGPYSLSLNLGGRFSANDIDQDDYSVHCAQLRHGGWWYNACTYINPNGDYATPGQRSSYDYGYGGMINQGWRGAKSLKSTKLMFRRI